MPLFRKQSAAKQTSLAPHDSMARLRVVTKRRGSWRSHVHRTYIEQRVQLFKIETANGRGRGGRPLVRSLWGFNGGYSLSQKRIPPLEPPEKGLGLAVSGLKGPLASGMQLPAYGEAALALRYDLPLLLSSAVAQPLAALLPYGCGTPLAGAALPIL